MTEPVPFTTSDRAMLQAVSTRTEQIVNILLPTLNDPLKPGLVREVHDLGVKLDGHISDTHGVAEQVKVDAREVADAVAVKVLETAAALAGTTRETAAPLAVKVLETAAALATQPSPPHGFLYDIGKQAVGAALAFIVVGALAIFLMGLRICASGGACS